jgi:hypothetical protein
MKILYQLRYSTLEIWRKGEWSSADVLRSTSNFASNEYFMPVMGLIFLRHACSRYLKVRDEILPTSITLKIAFASDGDMSSNLPT